MHIYYADCTGQERNCLYPHEVEITDDISLAEAVSRDYVCAAYRKNYRSKENFIQSDCLALEFDNDHSENPEEWVKPAQIVEAFPGVTMAIHYSRNHMKIKKGKAARPKFHLMIAIDPVTDPEAYAGMKRRLAAALRFADPGALDAARFFFGTENAEGDLPGRPGADRICAADRRAGGHRRNIPGSDDHRVRGRLERKVDLLEHDRRGDGRLCGTDFGGYPEFSASG